jgi:ankyrin repeat protein
VNRQIVVIVLAILMAASANAQTTLLWADVKAIDNGADPNAPKGGITPLMSAASANPNPEAIMVLLRAGANLEDRDENMGATPLLWAAFMNPNPELVVAFLRAGADLKATDQR